ncbi:adenosylhomocysteinase (plasmid) [Vibrio sp. HB236076]|uniref:Adenosylhomocysteinase n=2 Tax=unclassified Vibrio TaxID=2614977 RepID=A0AB39HGH4_9VIBR
MVKMQAALASLPDLSGVRLACNMHLDLKMAPLVKGIMDKGAEVFLTTCNPTTVQDEVVAYLVAHGAKAHAWRNMSEQEWQESFDRALAWQPTHLCEMGADLTTRLNQTKGQHHIRAGLEATGSGVTRLAGQVPAYPIFNWDDLPVKEGLHNRHMVGLTAWHTFFQTTHLTLHEKKVLVIGYGLVGQGVAASARAYGGQVMIAEKDPGRVLQAQYDGWPVVELDEVMGNVDVIATATGAEGVIQARHLEAVQSGVFILNVGHVAKEIEVSFLKRLAKHSQPLPYVDCYQLGEKSIFLLADGSMVNLTAGYGDSLNAFDVTLAVMVAGLGFIFTEGAQSPAGTYLLPESAWKAVL